MTPVSEGNNDVIGSVFLALASISSCLSFLVFSLLCHLDPLMNGLSSVIKKPLVGT